MKFEQQREMTGIKRMMQDTFPYGAGLAAISSPAWINYLESGWQFVIAVMGGVVLAMTIYSKYLEIKKRKLDLQEMKD